jgi:hypothetical protein
MWFEEAVLPVRHFDRPFADGHILQIPLIPLQLVTNPPPQLPPVTKRTQIIQGVNNELHQFLQLIKPVHLHWRINGQLPKLVLPNHVQFPQLFKKRLILHRITKLHMQGTLIPQRQLHTMGRTTASVMTQAIATTTTY